MNQKKNFLFVPIFYLFCSTDKKTSQHDKLVKAEMHLSAFGVESDDFPSIDIFIDFVTDSSKCHKWYFNPSYRDSSYSLSKKSLNTIRELLESADLQNLQKNYDTQRSDQPTSTITLVTNDTSFVFKDYGLLAGEPLREIYKIAYKF
jgi:hypothetical protein